MANTNSKPDRYRFAQRVKASLLVSLLQSVLLCTVFLYLLPLIFDGGAIWYVMLFVEVITAIVSILLMKKSQ